MTDLALIEQTEQSLKAIKEFALQSNNEQLLDYIQRLEIALSGLTQAGNSITVGNISGSTAVAIGRDINIIVNQVLPPVVRQPLENVQKQWSSAHLEVRKTLERSQGGHIFLSYSRADKEIAFQIRRELEQAGHTAWQDLTAIKGGDEWIKSIEEGVERCYALITVVSEASQKSEWVQIEYLHAKRRGKPIIPIKVDASEIPTILLATNVIHGYPDLNAGVQQLLASLPAPPAVKETRPADRRALELRYLDSVLLDHSVWQQVYTPMAGVGQLRVPKERRTSGVHMKTTPTTIDVGYLGHKFAGDDLDEKIRGESIPKQYKVDVTLAVKEMRQLVILGDPGAGKTTTLWKILSDQALQAKDDLTVPLPVLVRLGTLGSSGLEANIKAALGPLAEYYSDLWKEKRLAFLLDGLNEMTVSYRNANLQEICKLIEDCQKNNLIAVVTCRELDYTGILDLNLPGRVIIQPLDPLRIQCFVNSYIEEPGKGDELFWQLAGGPDVEKVWRKWEQAGASFECFWTSGDIPRKDPNVYGNITGHDNVVWYLNVRDRKRSMMALAANPYMLYMITQVFTQAGVLPPNRGLLFQTFIDYLLEKREHLSTEQASRLKTRLANLAYAMQAKGKGTAFTNGQAMAHLKDEQSFYHARSASLLTGRERVRFTHQLLQEYFAAHYLQDLMTSTSAEKLFAKWLKNGWWELESWESEGWEPERWEETIILLAGLYNDDCTPVIDWLQEAMPEVATRCILESGAHCPYETLALLQRLWVPRLIDLEHDPSPEIRAAVGRALGRLFISDIPLDNRKGVSVIQVEGTVLPDIDWVEIPAGDFLYHERERRVEHLFYIARYPVTFAQFQAFLDDSYGFANPHWWEGLSADASHKHIPGNQHFHFYNHPRENVSWYDAIAFCRWLTESISRYPQLLPEKLRFQNQFVISLPTESQWEKAAQGIDTYQYSYTGKFDEGSANTAETRIHQTSTVGIFPKSASSYSVMDMAGNIWEWCLNEFEKLENIELMGSAKRVVRGASWFDSKAFALISCRGFDPFIRNDDGGFRVVVHSL